jgi:hypothetical protein
MKTNPNPQKNLFQRTTEALKTPAKIATGIFVGATGLADNALAQQVSVRADRPAQVVKLSESPKSIFDELRIAEAEPKSIFDQLKIADDPKSKATRTKSIMDELEVVDGAKAKTSTLVSKTSTEKPFDEAHLDRIIDGYTGLGVLRKPEDFLKQQFDSKTGQTVTRDQAYNAYRDSIENRVRAEMKHPADFGGLLDAVYHFGVGDEKTGSGPIVPKALALSTVTDTLIDNNNDLSLLRDQLAVVRLSQRNKDYPQAITQLDKLSQGIQVVLDRKDAVDLVSKR